MVALRSLGSFIRYSGNTGEIDHCKSSAKIGLLESVFSTQFCNGTLGS